MSTTMMIALVALAICVVAVALAVRARGPRVTHIDTRRDDDGPGA